MQRPVLLSIQPIDMSSIAIRWHALNTSQWQSDRVGYRIYYRPYPNSNTSEQDTNAISSTSLNGGGVDELPLSETIPNDGKYEHFIHKLKRFSFKDILFVKITFIFFRS